MVGMKMTMAKLLSDNNNDSTNKQTKSWSFRRQYLWNISNSLYNNNAWLFVLESNRCPRANVTFLFFSEDSNAPLLNEPGLKDDSLCIWNVVWKLGCIRWPDRLKLIAGKRNIWCTMKIISKINSTYMSWISLHEEPPGTNLKIPLIRRNCKFVLASS